MTRDTAPRAGGVNVTGQRYRGSPASTMVASIRSQRRWMINRWISWTPAVLDEGTRMATSASNSILVRPHR